MKLLKTEFDAIVVGSGPGGATVARELTRSGKQVLILEWGDRDYVSGGVVQTIKRALMPGKGMLFTGQMLAMLRGITTGGSSLFYCATAFPPAFAMLERYGIDIAAEVAAVREEIPTAPLPDELIGPGAKKFMESALDLGYDCRKLGKFIYPTKCRPSCQLCSYGCPFGAKWNARNFVDQALENGARIQNGAKVKKVLIENRKAVGVEYKKGRETCRVFAPTVVVAAGGLGSPGILRKSGIADTGNEFFFDPLQLVYGRIDGINEGRAVPMSCGIHFPEDGVMITDFNIPRVVKTFFDLQVFRFGQSLRYKNTLPIMIKIRDQLGGRTTRRGFVWKKLSKQDKLTLKKGSEHAEKILRNAGATSVYKSWIFAAHPGGTVKIGEHVDENLKTEYDGLYVCDCSIIPEAWGLPPTMTLLGLGKRLAAHLAAAEETACHNRVELKKVG